MTASLVVRDIDKMSPAKLIEVANWLRDQADMIDSCPEGWYKATKTYRATGTFSIRKQKTP